MPPRSNFSLDALTPLGIIQRPSPVIEVPGFTAAHGVRLLIKREDALHPVVGSTKARRLDTVLGTALKDGVTDIVSLGAENSNQSRMIAWLGRQHGFATHIVRLPEPEGETSPRSINGYETRALGAQIHPLSEAERAFAPARARSLARRLSREGHKGARKAMAIGFGVPEPEGLPGMLAFARELRETPDWTTLLAPFGSGSTIHGLEAAAALGEPALSGNRRIIAASIGVEAERGEALLSTLRASATKTLSKPIVPLSQVEMHTAPEVSLQDAPARIDFWAREIAMVVDPHYHIPTLERLLTLIDDGVIAKGETVMFLMTGSAQDAYSHFARMTALQPSTS